MNLTFLIKKNHIFKKRFKDKFDYTKFYNNKTTGLYTINKIRIETKYIRILKKVFKKKYRRRFHMRYNNFWVLIKPNFILSMKSKNARMGSGVGSFVRVCAVIRSNKPLILTRNYYNLYLKKLKNKFKSKFNIDLLHFRKN